MPLKRLLVAPHDPAEFRGGTERVVEAMARVYVRRGDEVIVFAGSERREGEGRVESRGEPGLAVHRCVRAQEETAEHLLRPRIRAAFERLVDTVRPDVVHWHHGAGLSMDLVRAARARSAPAVMFLHDLWLSCPRYFRVPPVGVRCPDGDDRSPCPRCVGRDLPWEDDALEAWAAAFKAHAEGELAAAAARVAPSRAHAAAVQRFFPRVPLDVRVVAHGLLDPPSAAPPSRTGPAEPGRLRIASLGNLVPEKGLEDLAAALGTLADPRRVTLELHGAELSPGFVSRLRALAPSTPIEWRGAYASFPEIAGAVAASDVAAFPSRCHESYGLVVDEALAAGLPALVSDGGGLPERVGGAGEVLPMRDVAAWRGAVQRLLDEPARLARLRSAVSRRPRTIDDAVREVDALESAAGVAVV